MISSRHEPTCGCPENRALSRRTMLKGLGAAAAVAGAHTVAGPNLRTSFAAGPGDTLVVLSLRGGFDGLSAIAPVGDPHYAGLRKTQAVKSGLALGNDRTFVMHPSMDKLQPYWNDGSFAIALDVGQAHPTRSHFQAIKEMEKAAPDTNLRTGWLDRLNGVLGSSNAFTVTQVGTPTAPQAFNGPNTEMTLAGIDRFVLGRAWDASEVARTKQAIQALQVGGPAQVSGSTNAALAALGTVDVLRNAGYQVPADYPKDGATLTPLSQALSDTARLIKAGVGLKVATVECGNWDMHEGAGVNDGWMKNQLKQTADAIAAFIKDLGSAYANTTIVTISDFGRRVDMNGTQGFDHGHGNQMMVLGGGVNGGRFHGQWGGLAPEAQDRGGLPGRNDYRAVLGSVLTNRLRLSSAQLATVFPGVPSTLLDITRAA